MDDTPLFAGMASEEIQEFERSTGLQVTHEANWSDSDYDRVIAFLREMAARRTILRVRPRCACPGRPAWAGLPRFTGKYRAAVR